MPQSLASFKTGETGVILRLEGGYRFQTKMRDMGIREMKKIRLVAKQPFHGPVVIEIDGREVTLGRRMAEQIIAGHPE